MTVQFYFLGAMRAIERAGNKWIITCPACMRDFMLPHRIVYDIDGITALNPSLGGPNSIICGYANCRFHFQIRGGIATVAP